MPPPPSKIPLFAASLKLIILTYTPKSSQNNCFRKKVPIGSYWKPCDKSPDSYSQKHWIFTSHTEDTFKWGQLQKINMVHKKTKLQFNGWHLTEAASKVCLYFCCFSTWASFLSMVTYILFRRTGDDWKTWEKISWTNVESLVIIWENETYSYPLKVRICKTQAWVFQNKALITNSKFQP